MWEVHALLGDFSSQFVGDDPVDDTCGSSTSLFGVTVQDCFQGTQKWDIIITFITARFIYISEMMIIIMYTYSIQYCLHHTFIVMMTNPFGVASCSQWCCKLFPWFHPLGMTWVQFLGHRSPNSVERSPLWHPFVAFYLNSGCAILQ